MKYLLVLTTVWALFFSAGSASNTVVDSSISVPALHQAVQELGNGTLSFIYPTKNGVRGNGHGVEISQGNQTHRSFFRGHWGQNETMEPGPASIMLKVSGGRIRSISLTVGPKKTQQIGDNDLGLIVPHIAATFFMEIALQLSEDSAQEALLAAAIARDAAIAAGLLDIIRDRSQADFLREDALFWAATLAAEQVVGPVRDLIDEEDEDMDLREHAVFALSQMGQDVAMPHLMKIARNSQEPQLQEAAFFALAEFDSPEVIQLFEDILLEN